MHPEKLKNKQGMKTIFWALAYCYINLGEVQNLVIISQRERNNKPLN